MAPPRELPRTNGGTVLTQAPNAPDTLTPGIEAVKEIGKQVVAKGTDMAVDEAKQQGQQVVGLDPETQLPVIRGGLKTEIFAWDKAYNDAALAAYTAQGGADLKGGTAKFFQDNPSDPNGARALAQAYVKKYAATAQPAARGDLLSYGTQVTDQFWQEASAKAREVSAQNSAVSLKNHFDAQKADLLIFAGQSGIGTPEAVQAAQALKATGAAMRNPVLGFGDATVAAMLSDAHFEAVGEAMLSHGMAVAKSQGETAGLDAAQMFYLPHSALEGAPMAIRDSYASKLKQSVREYWSAVHAQRTENARQVESLVGDAKASAGTGGDWKKIVAPRQLYDTYGPAGAAAKIGEFDSAARKFSNGKIIATAPPQQVQQFLNSLDPTKPPVPNFDTTTAPGMVQPGNLSPWYRPILQNGDGSYSTTSSISIGTDAGEVLIPTVVDGKRLSNADAVAHFKATGENLGTFKTPQDADTYATALHNAQATMFDSKGSPRAEPPALSEDTAQSTIQSIFPDAVITSGARSPEHNAAVGGVAGSYHLTGQAVDFVLPKGVSFASVKSALEAKGLPVTELMNEGDHFHYAWGAHQADVPADFKNRLAEFQDAQDVVKKRQADLADDPAAYVANVRPDIAQQAASTDPQIRQRGINAMLSLQAQIGVPESRRTVMTKGQADYFTQQIQTGSADASVGALRTLTAGMTDAQLQIAARQIEPKDRALSAAVSAARSDPGLSSDIITGARFMAQNGDVKPDDKIASGILDGMTGGSSGMFSSTGGLFSFAPDARATAQAAASALYARSMIGGKPGAFNSAKYRDALKRVIGEPFTFRGQIIVAPREGMTASDTAELMRQVDDRAIKKYGNGWPIDAAGRPITAADVSRHGVLTWTGTPGRYRVMFPGQGHLGVAKNANGARTFQIDLGAMVGAH